MHVVLINQIADILHYNDNEWYFPTKSRQLKLKVSEWLY